MLQTCPPRRPSKQSRSHRICLSASDDLKSACYLNDFGTHRKAHPNPFANELTGKKESQSSGGASDKRSGGSSLLVKALAITAVAAAVAAAFMAGGGKIKADASRRR